MAKEHRHYHAHPGMGHEHAHEHGERQHHTAAPFGTPKVYDMELLQQLKASVEKVRQEQATKHD